MDDKLVFCSATGCYNIDCERHTFNLKHHSSRVAFTDFSPTCPMYIAYEKLSEFTPRRDKHKDMEH